METKREETERNIIEAAQKVFIENGFRGATMRDIAKEAGVNLAMMNYYFGSKERLFDRILDDTFSSMSEGIMIALSGNLSIEEKIRTFVRTYIDKIKENPSIPGFLFNELHQHPERLMERVKEQPQISQNIMSLAFQYEREVQAGRYRRVDPLEIMMNIVSMCAMPFLSKPILTGVFSIQDSTFEEMMEARKESIADFVLHSIRLEH